jgi:glycosyltransferase involved in cell wall biosynthesis
MRNFRRTSKSSLDLLFLLHQDTAEQTRSEKKKTHFCQIILSPFRRINQSLKNGMKILHIIPELNKEGAERLVVDMCNELRMRSGIEVCLVVFRPHNAYAAFSGDLNIRVISSTVVPSVSKKMTVQVTELQQFVDEFRPDVIHSHLFETEMVLSQVDCGDALRVMHFHDNMPQLDSLHLKTLFSKKTLTNWYDRCIFLKSWRKQAHRMALTISNDTTDYAKRVLPMGENVRRLLNAIVVERFTSMEAISRENLKLCMIGSLVPKKGQELAIRTVASLHEKGYAFHLHLLGDGPMMEELMALTHRLKLSEYVHFHGNVDHPEDYLQQSFAYLHTARYEPFGLVLLEAMAAGAPVVCTDGRGNRDLIHDGVNGYLIRERNPISIAQSIIGLLENRQLYHTIQQNALTFVQQFDIKNYTDRLLELYTR